MFTYLSSKTAQECHQQNHDGRHPAFGYVRATGRAREANLGQPPKQTALGLKELSY